MRYLQFSHWTKNKSIIKQNCFSSSITNYYFKYIFRTTALVIVQTKCHLPNKLVTSNILNESLPYLLRRYNILVIACYSLQIYLLPIGNDTRHRFQILPNVVKVLKLKILGDNSYICRSYRGKTSMETVFLPQFWIGLKITHRFFMKFARYLL